MLTSNNRERERERDSSINIFRSLSNLGYTSFGQTLEIAIFLSSLRIESNRKGVVREYANICPDANIFSFTVSPRRR